MRCAQCQRRIKGAFTWFMGHPFGPVCAKNMALTKTSEPRATKVVRDTLTLDLFGEVTNA